MTKSTVEEFVSTEDGMREFQRERAIYEVTDLIESAMNENRLTRSQLAKRIGRSKGWVTQLLDGESNKTIRTVADVLAVLGQEFCVSRRPIRVKPGKSRAFRIAPGTWAPEELRWPEKVIETGRMDIKVG